MDWDECRIRYNLADGFFLSISSTTGLLKVAECQIVYNFWGPLSLVVPGTSGFEVEDFSDKLFVESPGQ